MLCIHSDVPNKHGLIVDDLSASTSHASDSELDSTIIKPVIVDTACLDNSYLNNCVMPKPKESGTQGKFVPTCHNCRKIGHIRTNYYLLKSHKTWIKQDAMRKSEVDDSSSSKYVPPHRRHIKGKGNVVCKNANLNSVENVKKHSNKRSLPTCHHCGITGHIRSKCPQLQKLKFQKKLLHQALYLRWLFRLHSISKSLFLLIRVANQRRTNQGATRESCRSPMAAMAMKDC
jgi:transposase-like protein